MKHSKLKILLFRPHSKADELIPPFGLGYLATAIRQKHEVEILDGLKEKMTADKFRDFLSRKKFDVIGLQVFTFHINIVRKYVRVIKEFDSKIKIILGGPHPSSDAENIFYHFPEIEWAFKGEAEVGLAKLMDLLGQKKELEEKDLADIPGLIWRNKNNRTIINQQIFIEDLDNFGFPSWDLLRPDTYPLAPHGAFFKNYPVAPIIVTRGCPFSCTFCAGHLVSGKKIRRRSISSVIEEIKELYHKYGIREIHIEDDNFTFYKDLVMEFCRELKKNNLNISWTCPNGVRLDTLDEEILLAMKQSGLYSISVGIESGSDKILVQMQKNLNTEKIREKINLLRKASIEVIGFFIIGYPAETKEDILKTIEFARDLPLKRANFMIFKPFPGTAITSQLADSGELKDIDKNWDKFILADAIYAPSGLTARKLKQLRRLGFFRFYLRPRILTGLIGEIKNFSHFKIVAKRIFRWIFK